MLSPCRLKRRQLDDAIGIGVADGWEERDPPLDAEKSMSALGTWLLLFTVAAPRPGCAQPSRQQAEGPSVRGMSTKRETISMVQSLELLVLFAISAHPISMRSLLVSSIKWILHTSPDWRSQCWQIHHSSASNSRLHSPL